MLSVRRWHQDTHVILYSPEISAELKRTDYDSGADVVLQAPFSMKELLGTLDVIFSKGNADTFFNSVQLADLLQLMAMGKHSVDIMVTGPRQQRGIIEVMQGCLVQAETDGKLGVEALTAMLSWSNPSMKSTKGKPGAPPPGCEPLQEVLMQAVTQLNEIM